MPSNALATEEVRGAAFTNPLIRALTEKGQACASDLANVLSGQVESPPSDDQVFTELKRLEADKVVRRIKCDKQALNEMQTVFEVVV